MTIDACVCTLIELVSTITSQSVVVCV